MADVSFSSIHVVDGHEIGTTPQVSVQPAGKRSPRTGDTLIIFLDLPSAPVATCVELIRTLSEGYWRAPGGVTTALRLAIKLANDQLLEINQSMPVAQRFEGSLTCAVANNESVILAQAGPAIAFARSKSGAFERIVPVGSPSLIGSSHSAEPLFTHFSWQPNDVFVLTGTKSCSQVSDALINACMSKGDARMVAGYLNANVKQASMIGVAFTMDSQPAAVVTGDVQSTNKSQVGLPPQRASAQVAIQPTVASESIQPRNGAAGAIAVKGSPVLAAAGTAASKAMHSVARSMQRGLGLFGAQLLPTSVARTAPAERSRATVFGLAAAAILLPIIVALAVALLYFQFSGEAEKQQLRNSARAQIEQARSTGDSATAKSEWTLALNLITTYETRYPDDTLTFGEDKRQARAKLDQINKVTRVAPAMLSQLSPTSAKRRIAAGSLGVYVMDLGTNTAEYHVLNIQRDGVTGKPVPLTLAGGAAATNAQFRDLAWASPSSERWRTEGAVLFANDALYEYSSATGQMAPLKFAAGDQPGGISAGELYNGTAYLLDVGIGQIWRYTIRDNVLVKGDSYFRSPYKQLQDGIDLAVDGAIYILQKSGTVLKYFNRSPMPFNLSISNLPEAMGTVVAFAVNGVDSNIGSVYIGDASTGAVWQFSKSGEFQKQFRANADEFIGMEDISLDLTSNTLYVCTPTSLYSFKLG